MEHTSGITNTTTVHSHLKNLFFHVRSPSFIDICGKKCLSRTVGILAEKTLFLIRGLSMLHNISTVTGRTMYRGVYPQRFSCKGGHEKHRRKPKEGSLPILRSGYQSCYRHERNTILNEGQQIWYTTDL
jgi:hypothetical protein